MSEETNPRASALNSPPALSSRPWYLGTFLIGSVLVMGGVEHSRKAHVPEITLSALTPPDESAAVETVVIAELDTNLETRSETDREDTDVRSETQTEQLLETPLALMTPAVETDIATFPTDTQFSVDIPEESASFDLESVGTEDATPDPAPEITLDLPPKPALPSTYQLTVQPGDSLSTRFDRLGVPAGDVVSLLRAPHARRLLSRLRSGEVLIVTVNPDNSLDKLEYHSKAGKVLRVARNDNGFQSELEQPPPSPAKTVVVEGTINSSFFIDARKAGLSSSMRWQFTSMLSPVVDFGKQLRPGDRFRVLYEQYTNSVGDTKQDVLAVELKNRGKVHRAIKYTTASGTIGTFAPDGESLGTGGFLRYPLKYKRISSGFSKRRWHPKLNRVRAHVGVDFAAPTGTQIKSPGPGKVTFHGRKSGYGLVLEIEHGTRYKTVYAHLSRFARGLRKGSTVKKGQTIAYVGKSGLATGPHLHYELHVNGKPVNPLSARLPSGYELASKERSKFKAYAAELLDKLEKGSEAVTIAANNTAEPERL